MRKVTLLIILFLVAITTIANNDGVGPLIKVEWGQYEPYNADCPIINGQRAIAGCSAVAIAQAMTVYGVPKVDVNDNADVARFIHECGMAINTMYGTSSSAYTSDMLTGMATTLGYDRDMVIRTRDCYTEQEWIDMITAELDNGRPVIFSATDSKHGSHTFVVDGYKPGSDASPGGKLFHINWGWTGKENDYYDITDLRTKDYYFDKNHSIITGFKPDDDWQERNHFWEGVATISDKEIEQSSVGKVSIRLRMYNHYYTQQSMSFNAYLVPDEGKRVTLTRNRVYVMNVRTDSYSSKEITFVPDIAPGTYTLLIIYRPYAVFEDNTFHISGDTRITILPSTSGIDTPMVDTDHSEDGNVAAYNLSGQRVSPDTRGIVIINGKKYINN